MVRTLETGVAPEDGYESRVEMRFDAGREDWDVRAESTLFLKLRDGVFARARWMVRVQNEPFMVLNGVYNRAGLPTLD